MNKADTTTAKAKPLTERSPYLWQTVPAFWLNTEEGAENPFLPKGWVADNEEDVVGAISQSKDLHIRKYPFNAAKVKASNF